MTWVYLDTYVVLPLLAQDIRVLTNIHLCRQCEIKLMDTEPPTIFQSQTTAL